ncbi:MAG: hypothetical protein IH800_02485 [Myxococcales bacterium]|nr:hypothetical protein [Myxococcales bacterium]MCZ6712470.1 hypothetical protein [Deltaproteobacteria bacterium]TDJ02792.1 MAG: hypothetical protein E2O73_01405 [Deltaproteobacteria bacterium]TDJ08692.1 MAG: hypothetical protein E2O71_04030 [Deltaproteobacteria bacterium]
MKTGMDIFLRTPEHEELHLGKVSATTDKGYNAVFEGRAFGLEGGAEVLVFYEIKYRFMQQPVRVLSVVEEKQDDDRTRITLELETTGDPFSAEGRECYRVSCYSADIKAQLGKDPELCEVLEVSATGFSILSNAEYRVGQMLQATLYHNGTPVQGTAVLQSYRAFGKKNRYGFRAVDDKRPKATLKEDLTRINLAVQREQAARLSGNR